MTVMNQLDRFNLAMDVIDRVPRLQATSGAAREELKNKLIEHKIYVQSHGEDMEEIRNWSWTACTWPGASRPTIPHSTPPRAEPVRVLVVNAGSSSLKLAVMDGDHQVAATTVERWEGEDHLEPISSFVEEVDDLEAIGHRIVHGGPRLTESVLIDDDVLAYLDSIEDLAPLHNPRAVAGIRAVRQLLPAVPEVACFDTTFHTHLPAAARTYALPKEWNERWNLRRYGFHGLSHAYAVRRGARAHRPGPRTTCAWSRATSAPARRSPRCAADAASTRRWGSRRSRAW